MLWQYEGTIAANCHTLRKSEHLIAFIILPGGGGLPDTEMAPLTKDTIEAANSGAESAVSHASNQTKSAAGHMRSDAVSLEVAVRVHGTKVKEVVPGTAPHTEPFEEQTSTMIIFPQGGVLRMNTAVSVGQMLVLTNLKSRQDAICRVIKIRPNADRAAYIEVEFTQRQPGFWGVNYPLDADDVPHKSAPAAPIIPAGAESTEKPKSASDISWAPAPPPSGAHSNPVDSKPASKEFKPVAPVPPVQRLVPAAKRGPSFISIGSQEEVQPAASATAQIQSKHEAYVPPPSINAAPISFPPESPVEPPVSLSMSELRGDDDDAASSAAYATDTAIAEAEALAATAGPTSESSLNVFGSLSGSGALPAARSSSADDFGSRLDSSFGASAAEGGQPRVNWMLIAAGVAVLITVLGGGLYFRNRSSSNRATNANSPATVQQPAKTEPAPAPSNPAPPPVANSTAALPIPSSSPALAPPNPASGTVPAVIPNPPTTGKPVAGAPPLPIAIAKPLAPSVTPNMMSGSLKSHPTSTHRAHAADAGAAPVLDAPSEAETPTPALSGISSSPSIPAPPPPAIQQEGPVKIGGDVKEPRLIASALPVYPIGARQAGVEGDVVVNTTIDKTGNVVGMRVVSGPPLLRQAALDALRRWRYEPSKLNGQPVAVQMQVIIKFRR